ncbi:MAG: S9 family peptidase [Acidobacteria bacterium]|nr:S9 family peptidase [Acidobacteriota bacterium]
MKSMRTKKTVAGWCGLLILLAGGWLAGFLPAAEKRPLTVQDIMRFRQIQRPAIADEGGWVAYTARPDRGNPEGVVVSADGKTRHRLERGARPVLTATGEWATFVEEPDAAAIEAAGKDKKKREQLTNGLLLVNTATGERWQWPRVKEFALARDGGWLIRLHHREPEAKEAPGTEKGTEGAAAVATGEEAGTGQEPEKKNGEPKEDKSLGTTLVIRRLADGEEFTMEHVSRFALDPDSPTLVYAVSAPGAEGNGLFRRDLEKDPSVAVSLMGATGRFFPELAWSETGSRLAILQGPKPDEKIKKSRRHRLLVWAKGEADVRHVESGDNGWAFPAEADPKWTRDGKRLFVGLKPAELFAPDAETAEQPEAQSSTVEEVAAGEGVEAKPEEKAEEKIDLFDVDTLRDKRTLTIWHGDDPRIKPHEIKQWDHEQKRTYPHIYHWDEDRLVRLADGEVPDVRLGENSHKLLASSDIPYRRMTTWRGSLRDYYAVDLATGERILLLRGYQGYGAPSLSPGGAFAVYYEGGAYYLFDFDAGERRNLTAGLGVEFADEDHDYPSPAPGYGIAGWIEGDAAVLVYDKFDIWVLETRTNRRYRLTDGDGRTRQVRYRIVTLDPERQSYRPDEELLLLATSERLKNDAFCRARLGKPGVEPLLGANKKFRFLARARQADLILFTREDFQEFPDLWTADTRLSVPRKISDENPQIAEFRWGTPELVEWYSADGVPLQGVLIKPGDYQPGTRYPVLVYFYRLFSHQLYDFNEMTVNHRPNFPFYTSNGYALFLPDIRFEVGTPGLSAVKCLVPGVQKLIDMGVADPEAVALHGHSWSGYQTAYVITQTDLFACAVAGAPVANMTSAYSGLRYESGMARQFQYEVSQSRIGATLWERRDLYIENSPVFYADRIRTPLLLMHGDADGAVPWEQSIELYLALRRLDKDVVFLQYRGEPHHPQKYSNKVDYTLRLKEYLDHYLKGMPAPEWITRGEPYDGEK